MKDGKWEVSLFLVKNLSEEPDIFCSSKQSESHADLLQRAYIKISSNGKSPLSICPEISFAPGSST